MSKIAITIDKIRIVAELLDTPTARAVLDNLPFASMAQTWGDEVYFETPVQATVEDDARDQVEAGELAFWCEGSCIALGFGPTPLSQGDEIRLAAKTNIFARALDDVSVLKHARTGDSVFVEALQK